MLTFDEKLDRYAHLVVHVGLGFQAGQRLVIRAPIEAASFVRLVGEHAYRAGAKLVDVLWDDDRMSLIRLRNAPRDSFEEFPEWKAEMLVEACRRGDAILSIHAADPSLLKDEDPELIAIARRTADRHMAPFLEHVTKEAVNWCISAIPVKAWADQVFPGEQDAVATLWDAIFKAVRADQQDPVAVWEAHLRNLRGRSESLTERQYKTLHYKGPGTDLKIGLPDNHVWLGGRTTTKRGISHVPNLPTEEVFTLAHKDRVDGVIASTKPLSYAGRLIDQFGFKFEAGRVVDVWAEIGLETLKKLLDTDEGARRLGEVALVPNDSPISRSGILFYNTLFDENASSHLALGSAYRACLRGGTDMSGKAFAKAGGNQSDTHVDFMIGSGALDIDGITADGRVEPIMRQGEWAG